ncbi:MAG: twin-arginine translocation signal domain-containing protein, partial [Vicinamibacteria bacterium]
MKDRSRSSSRRRFLEGALAAAAAGLATGAPPVRASSRNRDRDRLERLVAEYGSELGELRRVQALEGPGGRY